MTRDQRLALLGPDTVSDIHRQVDAAPDPAPELVARLRPIMTCSAGCTPRQEPAAAAA